MAIVINGSGTISGITAQASAVELTDSTKLKLGTGDDLEVYHDGSHSYIDDVGTGDLHLRFSDDLRIQSNVGGTPETCIHIDEDGQVGLLYNGEYKLETTATGVELTGQLEGGEGHILLSGAGDNIAQFISDTNNAAHGGIIIQNGADNNYGTNYHIRFKDGDATEVGSVSSNTGTTSYTTSSDYRLKENVDYDFDATTRLKQLKPARFNFIRDELNTLKDGFLAHEVSSIVSEAVTGEKDAVDADGNAVHQGIDQSKLVPLLVKTIQELEARITALEA